MIWTGRECGRNLPLAGYNRDLRASGGARLIVFEGWIVLPRGLAGLPGWPSRALPALIREFEDTRIGSGAPASSEA